MLTKISNTALKIAMVMTGTVFAAAFILAILTATGKFIPWFLSFIRILCAVNVVCNIVALILWFVSSAVNRIKNGGEFYE